MSHPASKYQLSHAARSQGNVAITNSMSSLLSGSWIPLPVTIGGCSTANMPPWTRSSSRQSRLQPFRRARGP